MGRVSDYVVAFVHELLIKKDFQPNRQDRIMCHARTDYRNPMYREVLVRLLILYGAPSMALDACFPAGMTAFS
jgi:hypothetical protein